MDINAKSCGEITIVVRRPDGSIKAKRILKNKNNKPDSFEEIYKEDN